MPIRSSACLQPETVQASDGGKSHRAGEGDRTPATEVEVEALQIFSLMTEVQLLFEGSPKLADGFVQVQGGQARDASRGLRDTLHEGEVPGHQGGHAWMSHLQHIQKVWSDS